MRIFALFCLSLIVSVVGEVGAQSRVDGTSRSRYVAIAFDSTTKAVGTAANAASAQAAENEAIRQCNSKHCEIVASESFGCVSYVRSVNDPRNGRSGFANTREAAELGALAECKSCISVATVCSR
jgi:hypothetical protein